MIVLLWSFFSWWLDFSTGETSQPICKEFSTSLIEWHRDRDKLFKQLLEKKSIKQDYGEMNDQLPYFLASEIMSRFCKTWKKRTELGFLRTETVIEPTNLESLNSFECSGKFLDFVKDFLRHFSIRSATLVVNASKVTGMIFVV